MKKLSKISLLITTMALSILFTGNVLAKTYSEYKIGDKITYNNMDFYVIEDSDENKDSVTILKAEALTVDEVNEYGVGHINKNTHLNEGTAGNFLGNGYGGMTFYSSEICGKTDGPSMSITSGCTTDYDESDVKYAVDAWAVTNFIANDLVEDSLGYKARLITYDELVNNLGYAHATWQPSYWQMNPETTPSWVYNVKYCYWTMSQYMDSSYEVWLVASDGNLGCNYVHYSDHVSIRPVVTLKKKPIGVYYNIDTKTDDNGTVEIDKKEALENEKVKISITANEGYKLKSLRIYKTSDNEDVTDKVSYNTATNEFIMPAYDVTVSAEFEEILENKEVIEKENPSENENKIENPKTIDKINTYIIISGLGIGTIIIFMLYKRKLNIK